MEIVHHCKKKIFYIIYLFTINILCPLSPRLFFHFCILSLSCTFSSEELPTIDQWQCATPLDHSLRHIRVLHLKQIVAAALALKHGPATELSIVLEQAEDWASRLRTMAEEVRFIMFVAVTNINTNINSFSLFFPLFLFLSLRTVCQTS